MVGYSDGLDMAVEHFTLTLGMVMVVKDLCSIFYFYFFDKAIHLAYRIVLVFVLTGIRTREPFNAPACCLTLRFYHFS